MRHIKIKKRLEQADQDEISRTEQIDHQGTVMQGLPPTGHEIQEVARTAQDSPGREARNENSVEMEQNNLEGLHTPLHRSILEAMHKEQKEGLPYLKSCDRSKLRAKAAIVNDTVKDTLTKDITEMKSLPYAAVYVVS